MLRTRSSSSRAFTLIELLVVIAIIAILFPVFAQAKLAAKKTAELSSIKQIGTGTVLYINDNDDAFPLLEFISPDFDQTNAYRWSSSLCVGAYVKSAAIFLSPVDTAVKPALTEGLILQPLGRSAKATTNSFMANGLDPSFITGGGFPPTVTAASARGVFGTGHYYGYEQPEQMSSASQTAIEAPSETVLLAGGAVEVLKYIGFPCPDAKGPNTEVIRCFLEDLFSPGFTLAIVNPSIAGVDPNLKTAWQKFNGVGNYTFCDTSAKSLKPGALLQGSYLSPRRFLISPGE